MLQASYQTGPAIGPHGRGHTHTITIDGVPNVQLEYVENVQLEGGLGVASEATWWSTARSGGRYGLGAINVRRDLEGKVNLGVTLGGAMAGAFLGGLLLGGRSRLMAGAGAAGGAVVVGFFSKFIAESIITFKDDAKKKTEPGYKPPTAQDLEGWY